MDYYESSLRLHALNKGKIEVAPKVPVKTKDDLAVAYTPGVAEPCMLIKQDPENARAYSIKANTVAVVSDGSATLGLGNIGGLASLPAMEGKALLLKEFGGIDAFPICLDTQDPDEIVKTVKNIAPVFGGVNLAGIAAPACFEIEKRLKAELDIPVFQDNTSGIAMAVSAAVLNAFRLLGKPLSDVRAVICGAGAAGNAIAKMLPKIGLRDIIVCDSKGIIGASRFTEFGEDKLELLEFTNKDGLTGGLAEAVRGRDLLIGVSKSEALTAGLVSSMAKDAVVFALSCPEPEILPDAAKAAGARIVGTGLLRFPNTVDPMLLSPAIFRGTFDARASVITEAMMLAAVQALAGLVSDKDLSEDHILPSVFETGLCEKIAKSLASAWEKM